MLWRCGICQNHECLSLRELTQHINRRHGSMVPFHIFCGINNCPQGYSSYSAFYKHVRNKHACYYESDMRIHRSRMQGVTQPNLQQDRHVVQVVCAANTQEHVFPQNLADIEQEDECHDDDDVDDCVNRGDIEDNTDDEFDELATQAEMTQMAAEFLVGLKDKHEMTQRAVQDVKEGCCSIIQSTLENAKAKILQRLSVLNDPEQETSKAIVEHTFMNIYDPFERLNSAYMQKKYLERECNYIKPHSMRLGYSLQRKLIDSEVRLIRVPDYVYYVPLKESVAQFLSNPHIYEMCSQNPILAPDGFLLDMCDGSYVKNHNMYRGMDRNNLMFQLYYDDLEISSALSNASLSMSLFYYRLLNVPLLYRSRLESIRLFAVCEKSILNEYGIMKIMKPFSEAMKDLDTNGWDIEIDANLVHFGGGLINLVGDTPAINGMGGFKKGVGFSHIKCRHCECRFPEMQRNFLETDFRMLDLNQYLEKCRLLDMAQEIGKDVYNNTSKNFGINEKSCLIECPGFDVTQALPQDVMHIFLEGCAPYALKAILQKCILNDERFTLEAFNERLRLFFSKFKRESYQIPKEITRQTLQKNDGTLKQNSTQMNSLITALPFIFSDLMNERSNLGNLILDIVKLRNILFSPVISHGTLANLRTMIREHLELFKRTFPAVNIVPKQHFLIHFPNIIAKFGPPIRYHAFRFESKHKGLKRKVRASQNYKNVSLTIYTAAQSEDTIQNNIQNPKLHALFQDDFKPGSCKLVDQDVLEEIKKELENDQIQMCYTTKYVNLCGNKFIANYTLVPIDVSNFNFVFGIIRDIFIFDMSKTYFKVEIFDTLRLNERLQAIQIEQQDNPDFRFVKPENLLDHKPYYSLDFLEQNYVPLHYDVIDMIDLAERGYGNLHNKLNMKV